MGYFSLKHSKAREVHAHLNWVILTMITRKVSRGPRAKKTCRLEATQEIEMLEADSSTNYKFEIIFLVSNSTAGIVKNYIQQELIVHQVDYHNFLGRVCKQ